MRACTHTHTHTQSIKNTKWQRKEKKCTRERESWTKRGWEPGNRKCGRRKWEEEGKRRGRDRKMCRQSGCFVCASAHFVRWRTIFLPFQKLTKWSLFVLLLPLGQVWSLTTTVYMMSQYYTSDSLIEITLSHCPENNMRKSNAAPIKSDCWRFIQQLCHKWIIDDESMWLMLTHILMSGCTRNTSAYFYAQCMSLTRTEAQVANKAYCHLISCSVGGRLYSWSLTFVD